MYKLQVNRETPKSFLYSNAPSQILFSVTVQETSESIIQGAK
jgi:hypothetical protein